MDKHSKCSLYRLRMALAISIAFCFTTDIFAQATSTTDSTAITTPDTVGELVNGLNTVDRKSTRLNSSHASKSRMPSSA